MKKKQSFLRTKIIGCFLAILLFICVNTRLSAQHFINEGACPADTIDMGTFVIGTTPPGPTITAQAFEDANPTMSLVGGSIKIISPEFAIDEATFTAITGMTFSIASPIITLTTSPIPSGSAGTALCFSISVNDGGEPACVRIFKLKIVRKSIDLMFVLDKSGSMGAALNGGTRWSHLTSGVENFFIGYKPFLLPSGDRAGAQLFGSTDHPPTNAASPFHAGGLIPITSTTVTNTMLTGDSPGGSTGMGAGLLSAKNFLLPGGADNGNVKSIILFTDGEQNVPPPPVVAVAAANPTAGGTDLSAGDRIRIHTIGLGVPGPATQRLYHIANETGGQSNIVDANPMTVPNLNLTNTFTTIRNSLLAGSSPQFVDVRRNKFQVSGNSSGCTESFTVNKFIDKILVNLITDITNESQVIEIEKDGVKLNLADSSYVKAFFGQGHQTWVINVQAAKIKIPALVSEGNWIVRAKNAAAASTSPYIMSLTVDDHNSTMTGNITPSKELVVGDQLPISVDFTKFSTPMTGATANAIVLEADEDMGDLLARTGVDMKFNTDPDADNVGTQKFYELLKDSLFAKKLLASNNLVNLSFDAGKKMYVGNYSGLDVSGGYKIIYQVSVNDPFLGNIVRYQEKYFYVAFPAIDLAGSNVSLTKSGDTTFIKMRPICTNKKYIGPGWGAGFKLDSSSASINRIIDHADGSYTIAILGDINGTGKLSVGSQTVYNGKLSDIDKAGDEFWKQWWFWVLLILLLIILYFIFRKKKP
jgi:von Willebrand factor type A domain